MADIREGRWLCPSCSNENLGRFEQCRSCGDRRASNVPFYLPVGEPLVSDEELLADAKSGFDWHCDHCGSSNKAVDDRCTGCGNLRDEGDKIHDARHDQVLTSRTQVKPAQFDRPREVNQPSKARAVKSRDMKLPVWIKLGAMALLAIVLLLASFLVPIDHPGKVVDLSWNRQIDVSVIKALVKSGWDKPSDAYDITSETRIKNYKTVTIGYKPETRSVSERYSTGSESYSCGQESLGNGYFQTKTCTRETYGTRQVTETVQVPITEQQPVQANWYEYTIDRWVKTRDVRSSGGSDAPYWPELELAEPEREEGRIATYVVTTKIDDKFEISELPFEEWQRYAIDDKVVATTDFWGNLKAVALVKPE